MNEKYLEKCIKDNLKVMIDGSAPVDIEKSWNYFEKRLNEKEEEVKEKKKIKQNHLLALVAVLALALITPMVMANKVTAFKSEVYQWIFSTNNGQEKVIKQNTNIKIEKGLYTDLTFEEAQSMTIYNIKYPNYLPEDIINKPIITINAGSYPYAKTNILFENDSKTLVITQENIIGEKKANIYIPKNAEIKKFVEKDVEYTLIKNDINYQLYWHDNSINYLIISRNIKYDELIKIVKNLK